MSQSDPASLADAARILRRLADDLEESAAALGSTARGPVNAGPAGVPGAGLTQLRAVCEATAAGARGGGSALQKTAYALADHAHARSALADGARAAGLAVADAPQESTPRLTLTPGIAGIADAEQVTARARVLVEFTERRRALAESHGCREAALRDRLRELTATLEEVARTLR